MGVSIMNKTMHKIKDLLSSLNNNHNNKTLKKIALVTLTYIKLKAKTKQIKKQNNLDSRF